MQEEYHPHSWYLLIGLDPLPMACVACIFEMKLDKEESDWIPSPLPKSHLVSRGKQAAIEVASPR